MNHFSPATYRELLGQFLHHGYPFVDYSGIHTKGLILRHDVDYSPEWASELAKINHDMGVIGTFFLLVDSQLYNLFSISSQRSIRNLTACNQRIGLHLSCSPELPSAESIQSKFKILKLAAPEAEKIIAWHNPPQKLDKLNELAAKTDFENAYRPDYFGAQKYFSDSNLRHSPKSIFEGVRQSSEPVVQILLHPFNWIAQGSTIKDILMDTYAHCVQKTLDTFDDNIVWKTQCAASKGMDLAGSMEDKD